jgi:hypothetical protein
MQQKPSEVGVPLAVVLKNGLVGNLDPVAGLGFTEGIIAV